jgi:hypothetical protein
MHSHAECSDHIKQTGAQLTRRSTGRPDSSTLARPDRSHALRGNAAGDALRSAVDTRLESCARVTRSVTGCIPTRSVGTIESRAGSLPQKAEQHTAVASHHSSGRAFLIVPTLCVGMPPGTLCVPLSMRGLSLRKGDAERHGMHSHAERGNDQDQRHREQAHSHIKQIGAELLLLTTHQAER